jgi:hypothetical protein
MVKTASKVTLSETLRKRVSYDLPFSDFNAFGAQQKVASPKQTAEQATSLKNQNRSGRRLSQMGIKACGTKSHDLLSI